MNRFIEKGYGWPLFIVVLLVSSVVMMGLVVMAARSDGGAQVISDYYEQAVRWDSVATLRDAASARGWNATLDVERTAGELHGRITIVDSTGTPLLFPTARVTVTRPQFAETSSDIDAASVEGSPVLIFRMPLDGSGLHDIRALVTDAQGPVLFSWRREF